MTEPRQPGKTTLVRHSFPDKPYANLEEIDIQQMAKEDPRIRGYQVLNYAHTYRIN